jgi:hypothetical protein
VGNLATVERCPRSIRQIAIRYRQEAAIGPSILRLIMIEDGCSRELDG